MSLEIYGLVEQVADQLEDRGIFLDGAYKRRDRREPGRTEKVVFEDQLAAALRKRFSAQQAALAAWVRETVDKERRAPAKAIFDIPAELLGHEASEAILFSILIQSGEHGLELFAAQATVGFDLASYQARTAEHIRESIGDMIKRVDDVTRERVQEAVAAYVETPGMTLGDLVRQMPFDKQRALTVARTEITQAYGEINRIAGEQLAADYPDVVVEEQWFTNRGNPCPICIGLDGVVRRPGEPFFHKRTGAPYMGPKDTHPNCQCWTQVRTRINA